jgi:hypothetical protein
MFCGFLVSYHRIQLPGFERGRIPRVVNADSEFCSSPWFASHASIPQREFQFEFLPSDPVRLVPMDLCGVNRTMPEAYFGNAPQFPPPPLAIHPPQSLANANPASHGDGLDRGDFADNLKFHASSTTTVGAWS